jgi:hypothetical protein
MNMSYDLSDKGHMLACHHHTSASQHSHESRDIFQNADLSLIFATFIAGRYRSL